jgi:hypothetical protein
MALKILVSAIILICLSIVGAATADDTRTEKFEDFLPGVHRHYKNAEGEKLVLFDEDIQVSNKGVITLFSTPTWMDYRMGDKMEYLIMCIDKRRIMYPPVNGRYHKVRVLFKGKEVYSMEFNPKAQINGLFKDMTKSKVQWVNFGL